MLSGSEGMWASTPDVCVAQVIPPPPGWGPPFWGTVPNTHRTLPTKGKGEIPVSALSLKKKKI